MENLLSIAKSAALLFCVIFMFGFIDLDVFAQLDEVDSTFNPNVTKDVASNVTGNLAIQPDGKILIFGVFQTGGTYLNRLNSDGTTDASFICGVCSNGINVANLLVLTNGKIILTGYTDVARAYRLNADGSLDITYNVDPNSGLGFVSEIEALAEQLDGKILVRHRSSSQGYSLQEILRYNVDGTRDMSFTTNGYGPLRFSQAFYARVLALPDGKILIGGTISGGFGSSGFIYRTNADGTQDTTFESPTLTDPENRSAVGYFDVYPDGSIIVPGKFTTVNSLSRTDLVRLLPAGNVDLNFIPDDVFSRIDTSTSKSRVLPGGQFLVSSVVYSSVFPVPPDNRLYRFNSNGTLDSTYNHAIQLTLVSNWTLDSSNRALVFGVNAGITRYSRVNTDGSLDSSFSPTLVKRGIINKLVVQGDGKILLIGDFNRVEGVIKNNFARVNADGTLDPTFDSGSGFDVVPREIIVQVDGKIIAIGDFATYNSTPIARITRLNSDGSLDTSFNPNFNSVISSVAIGSNGKILVGGSFTAVNGSNQPRVARLNADGSLDSSFNPVIGSGQVYSIFVESNGQIMVGGAYSGVNGFNRSNLVRFNSDGSLDSSFNAGSISSVNVIVPYSDGKYIILQRNSAPSGIIIRRNSDGSADTSFQLPTINGTVNSIYLQSDGKIIAGGGFSSPRPNFARFLMNGGLDATFLPTGANNTVYAIAGQPDGKILVGGNFVLIGGVLRSGIARVSIRAVQARTLFDFDGDARADVSVFRPSTNRWYGLLSSNSTVTEQDFGVAGDVVAPADYDGDGKTDIGIFRPLAGDWWYKSSINGGQVNVHWGAAGDIPRPGDFDGDGKADFVVYRPSNGVWYRFGSTGQVSIAAFGASGDKPVVGDFDGDGKSDMAIFRPSTGDWWYQSSISNAQIATRWGISTDVPTPADFDGDGKTDLAVYRPATGAWYIINSSNGSFTILGFGLAEDKPVASDYDGDGKADVAVNRPSTGVWYLLRSTSGFTALQFGISTDIPTPNAFVP